MSRLRHAVTGMLASIVMSSGTASAAHAQLTAADSATFVRVTQSLLDAITYGDSSVWAPHLTPEWFIIDEEGNRLSRADFLPTLRGLPPGQSGVLRGDAPGPRTLACSSPCDKLLRTIPATTPYRRNAPADL